MARGHKRNAVMNKTKIAMVTKAVLAFNACSSLCYVLFAVLMNVMR